MSDHIAAVKKKLDDAITQLCEVSWMFSKCPEKDFTRCRKLPLRKVISLLLAMEGGTLTTELQNILAALRMLPLRLLLFNKEVKSTAMLFLASYNMPFRIVRFKISDDTYETVVTNLDVSLFPSEELKSFTICVGALKLPSES